MSYFTPEYTTFFAELTANNNKEWFDANRKRYEQHVKKPFDAFIRDLIAGVAAFEPEVQIQPKDAIFRINRDIRFSKDKTPYKENRSAAISENGRRHSDTPAYYIQIGVDTIHLGGGCYGPDKAALAAIRSEIAAEPDAIQKLVTDKAFKKAYGEVKGEENKVLPKEYKEAGAQQPLLYKKSYYYMTDLPTDPLLYSEELLDTVLDMFKIGKPVNDYLKHAMAG